MKTEIHPKYQEITFSCACGAKFVAGSTIEKEFKTEVCSNCHPFYTGKQKLLDSSGRIDKFREKMKNAQEKAEKSVKKVKKGEEEEAAKESVEEKVEKKEKKPKKAKKTEEKEEK